MVDPYAIVRRLTGHELISPKDARLLTEAVDGLIDEIGGKDARIAELEAEIERLREQITKATDPTYLEEKLRQIGVTDEMATEALSRTGAVKVKALDEDDYEEIISAAAINMRKATSGIRGQMVTVQDCLDWWVMKETERRILAALTAGKPEQVPSGWKRNRYECPTCGGSGEIAPDAECPDCDGTGACVPASPTAGGGE